MSSNNLRWLQWAREIQSIAHMGLSYSENPFDIERYHMLQDISAQILAEYSQTPIEQIHTLFELNQGVLTPKVDVRGVVFQNNAILLVKEKLDGGRWTLPGGWANVAEPPSLTVTREIREESGYETRAIKLIALYDRDLHQHPPSAYHTYKLFFLCELLGGQATTSIETEGAEFFAQDQLPDNLSTSRVTRQQLERCFDHRYHPDWPTDFD